MIPVSRILIVDRLGPFRHLLSSILKIIPGFLVVGEASDGLEAVQKAEELKPDLIFLDVALPNLNGIEAARQIRKLAPHSRVLFLTKESDLDIVREALNTGAIGYVLKANLIDEILDATAAVTSGQRFLSGGIRP